MAHGWITPHGCGGSAYRRWRRRRLCFKGSPGRLLYSNLAITKCQQKAGNTYRYQSDAPAIGFGNKTARQQNPASCRNCRPALAWPWRAPDDEAGSNQLIIEWLAGFTPASPIPTPIRKSSRLIKPAARPLKEVIKEKITRLATMIHLRLY